MRRLILLILMLVVPLQYTWSAVMAMDAHSVHAPMTMSAHSHGHDHVCHDLSASAEQGSQPDNGHHGGHCHHVLSMALLGDVPLLAHVISNDKIGEWHRTFSSRTPPLLDRPPVMRA